MRVPDKTAAACVVDAAVYPVPTTAELGACVTAAINALVLHTGSPAPSCATSTYAKPTPYALTASSDATIAEKAARGAYTSTTRCGLATAKAAPTAAVKFDAPPSNIKVESAIDEAIDGV